MAGPLTGIKVLDLSAVVSGPLTAALLADQGAEVIKVERLTGDIQRNVGSRRNGYSGSFHMLNRGKRSIALDLSAPAGVQIVTRLADRADVVIQNFRPGVVNRLGIGYDALRKTNPRIVYLSISGFGQHGPNAGRRAYDPIIQACSGMADVQGLRRGEGPEQVNQLIMDKLTAYTGCQAITAALFARERNGEGQHIELSMLDAAVAFLWPDAGADDILLGEDIEHRPPIRAAGTLAELKDGWVTMMTLSDHEFHGLCRALELSEISDDPRFNTLAARQENREAYVTEIKASLDRALSKLSVEEAEARLSAEHVPFSHVFKLAEVPFEAQIQANELFFEREHPVAGLMRETRPAPIFTGTPTRGAGFAPTIGQHTREILGELEMTEDIGRLIEDGVIATES